MAAATGFNGGEPLDSTKNGNPRFLVENDAERLQRERNEYWDWTHRVRTANRDGKRA